MRSIRKLALLGLAALVVAAVVASAASATTIRTGSSTGPTYSGAVTGTNVGNVVLSASSGIGTVTCTSSMLNGSVTSTGGATITAATWDNNGGACSNNLGQSCTATAQNLDPNPSGATWTGSVSYISLSGTPSGTLTVSGSPYAGAKVVCGSTTCYYGKTTSVSVDVNNPMGTTGSQAIANVVLDKQSGSGFGCSSTSTWTATYNLTENGVADLWVTA